MVVGLIVYWPWLRNTFDRLTLRGGGVSAVRSSSNEYWCPMCPGVVSDWPAKCPVCHMDLVQRVKGEAVPLPDGVIARMQFTPYRVQLAGIRTTPAEYRPMTWEAKAGGYVMESENKILEVRIDVPASGLAGVKRGLAAEIEAEAFPGRTFPAKVLDVITNIDSGTQSFKARIAIDSPRAELNPGLFVIVRLRVPLPHIDSVARRSREDWRDRTACELALHTVHLFADAAPGLRSLVEESCSFACRAHGQMLAIPAASVIDTGDRKVVFVERMTGMFDGVEVTLGQRCGDYFPVIRGLEPGNRVVTSGAVLLDAETRLNPSLAASYFGAASRPTRAESGPQPPTASEDEKVIASQKICPVTEADLGSMGAPVKVMVNGRAVYICCQGCEKELKKNATKYLTKIPPKPPQP